MAPKPRAAPRLVKLALPPPWAVIGLSRRDERTSFDAVGVRRQVPSMILCPLQRLLTGGLTSPSMMAPGRAPSCKGTVTKLSIRTVPSTITLGLSSESRTVLGTREKRIGWLLC